MTSTAGGDKAAAAEDDDDDSAAAAFRPSRSLRVAALLIGVAGAAVVVTFLLALGSGRPGPDLGIVVVTDPVPRHDPVPVLAVVVGPTAIAPLQGTVNGRATAATSITAIVEVPTAGGIDVAGEALWQGQWEPVALHVAADALPATALSTTLSVSKAPTLAIPALGAAVFPVAGLVPPQGPTEVVLVDDTVRVVVVDVATDGRLPDGRLLAVDRRPYAATLQTGDGTTTVVDVVVEVVVEVVARADVVGLVGLVVGGRLLGLRRLAVPAGETARLVFSLGDTGRVGDVVVATISTAIVPGVDGATDLQLVGRVGGFRDEDLLLVEPRAAPALADPRVRTALGRRLVIKGGGPAVVSPSMAAQRRERLAAAQRDADDARARYRVAALVLVAAVLLSGGLGAGRVKALAVVVALLLVGAMLVGLDRVLDGVTATAAIADLGATSGSP